jgi:hypothetical protein
MSNLSFIVAKIPIPVSLLGIIGVIIALIVALAVCWFVGVMIGAGLGKLIGMDSDAGATVGGLGGVTGLVIGIAIVYFGWRFIPTVDVFGVPADVVVCFVVGVVGAVLVGKASGMT